MPESSGMGGVKKTRRACDISHFFAFNRDMMTHPFLELIEQHSSLIDRISRSFARTAEDRMDLRQDIVMNLWVGWKRYRPSAKPVTWVWRVATNTAISWYRHRLRHAETVGLEWVDVPEDVADKEQVERLGVMMARLPENDQRLLRLYLDGWRQDEIAEMMGISRTNVQTRMGRIKQKLKGME